MQLTEVVKLGFHQWPHLALCLFSNYIKCSTSNTRINCIHMIWVETAPSPTICILLSYNELIFIYIIKTVIKTVYMEGHKCRQNTLMFALVFCFELRARAVRTCCHCHLAVKNQIYDGNRGQLKLPKIHEQYHNVVMWHWIVYKWRRNKQMLGFHCTFFNLLDFTVSLSYRDWHSETPWSHSSNQPGGTYCRAQDLL